MVGSPSVELGADGTDYQEWIAWTEITPPERIALRAQRPAHATWSG
jgi:hypothetical protein